MEWQKTFRPWYHTFLPGNQGICTGKSLSHQGVKYRQSSVRVIISKGSPVYKTLFIKLFKKSNTKKKNLGLSAAALPSAFVGAVRSTPQPPCRQYSFARQISYGGFAGYLLPSPIPSASESLLGFYHNITFGKVAAVL